jgi:hypothetical protein
VLGAFSILLAIPTGISGTGAIVFLTRLFILFGIILTLNTRRWVYRGWMILLILAVLSLVVASFEIITGWHWSGSMLTELPDAPRYSNLASVWYHNINDFSFFALVGTIPALILALKPTTNFHTRIFFASIWITGAIITFQIFSRATMLAYPLVIITAVALVHSHGIRKLLCRVPVRVGEVTLPSIGVFSAVVFYQVPNPITNVGSSLWTRWQLQKAAVLEGGIIGQGLGSASAIIGSSTITGLGGSSLAAPHSWYGAIVSETGMLGLILFLIFYGGLLTKLSRISNMTDSVQIMSVTALVTLPIAGLGPSNVLRMPTWWIVIGLAVATCNYKMNDPLRPS